MDAFVLVVMLFSLYIMPINALWKLLIVVVFTALLLIPVTAQFFDFAFPVLGWVMLFFNSKYIPLELKRPISVQVLPALETIFFGADLSELLASDTSELLDVIFWIPYGIIHFSLPFLVAALVFIFAPPTTLRSFAWGFGFLNLIGVIIQDLIFPCAPPWYKVLHGLEKANYSMKGSPGGLGRIDKLFGINVYTPAFTNSPLIFGAMPSLHSGCATFDCLWLCYLFPSFTPLWCVYVMWLWASTMYLTHHYFIDLVAGSCLSISFFGILLVTGYLPKHTKLCRWSYTEVEYRDICSEDPLQAEPYMELNSSTGIETDLDLEPNTVELQHMSDPFSIDDDDDDDDDDNEL